MQSDDDSEYERNSFSSDAYDPADLMMGDEEPERDSFSSDAHDPADFMMRGEDERDSFSSDAHDPADFMMTDQTHPIQPPMNTGGNRKHKTKKSKKGRKSKRSRKNKRTKRSKKNKIGRKTRRMRNTMKNRGKGKEWKMTPITDKKELQRLEEYEKRAAERERNDNEIKRIHSQLEKQRKNVISGLMGTPMNQKDVERQKEEDEQHNKRVNSKKAKSRKLTIYDL